MDFTILPNDVYHVKRYTVPELGEHTYNIKLSQDGKYAAASFGNGAIRLFDVKTDSATATTALEPRERTKLGNPYDDLPTTVVKWCHAPSSAEGAAEDGAGDHHHHSGSDRALVSASSAGAVFGWRWDTSGYLEKAFRLPEEKNEIAAIDVSPDGVHFVTAGSDRQVRVYDFSAAKLVNTMNKAVNPEGHSHHAHINRIFALKYVSTTTLLSGGWESPIQVWDLRTGRAERQVSGAQISSDAFELLPNTTRFLTASNRQTNQVQMFDYLSCREIEAESVKLSKAIGKGQLSFVKADVQAKTIFVATTKPFQVIEIDMTTGERVGLIECPSPIMSLDVSPSHPGRVFIACMNETIIVAQRKK